MSALTVLGVDPGSRNMGFGVLQAKVGGKGLNYRVREVGMIQNTVKEMKGDVRGDLQKFRKEFNAILRRHKVDVIVAERYMNRGIRGNTGELVGLMLGVIAMSNVQDVSFIPAAQWKNAFNRNASLDQLYKDSRLVAHVVDASCISAYGLCTYLEHKPFEFVGNAKGLAKFRTLLDKAQIK